MALTRRAVARRARPRGPRHRRPREHPRARRLRGRRLPAARSSTRSCSADADLARFARLGVVASVQPEHAMDDRDIADRLLGRPHRPGVRRRVARPAPGAPAARVGRPGRAARPVGVDRRRRRPGPRRPRPVAPRAADPSAPARRGPTAGGSRPARRRPGPADPTRRRRDAELRRTRRLATLLGGRFTHRALLGACVATFCTCVTDGRRPEEAAAVVVGRGCVAQPADVRGEEPAVLLEAAGDLDGDVLARGVELAELVDRLARTSDERGVDLGDQLGDRHARSGCKPGEVGGMTVLAATVSMRPSTPGMDGLSVLARLRQAHSTARILILTARDEVTDRVKGLKAGADDYLGKPFSMNELIARVEALGRRAATPTAVDLLKVADLQMDVQHRHVSRAGQSIALSPREFDVLQVLMQEPGRVFSRTELCERIWQREHEYDTRTVEIFIARLRKKIDEGFDSPLIYTQRYVGYTIRDPTAE